MSCPVSVSHAVIQIIQQGLLQIRSAAWSQDPEVCAAVADHLHNLPNLLEEYSPERLDYYWDTERTAFLNHVDEEISAIYHPFWDELKTHIGRRQPTVSKP